MSLSVLQRELFAEARGTEGPVRQVMDRSEPLPDGVFVYSASVEGTRPAADYTPRVIPNHPAGAIPLEATAICWQK
jgi:starch phosphorylase